MGLDISYYRQVRLAPEAKVDEDGCPEDWDMFTRAYVNPDFASRADDIVDRAIYETTDGEGFRAGSYTGYNAWREQLAVLAGYPASSDERHPHAGAVWEGLVTEGPFYELINFADNEGIIGPITSAKLAKDFAAHQPKADAHSNEYFRSKYDCWRKAFETASDGGFVDFH